MSTCCLALFGRAMQAVLLAEDSPCWIQDDTMLLVLLWDLRDCLCGDSLMYVCHQLAPPAADVSERCNRETDSKRQSALPFPKGCMEAQGIESHMPLAGCLPTWHGDSAGNRARQLNLLLPSVHLCLLSKQKEYHSRAEICQVISK